MSRSCLQERTLILVFSRKVVPSLLVWKTAWFSDSDDFEEPKAKKQRKSMSLEMEKSWQNRFEMVKKKLRNLQRVFYPKIPSKMTAGLSTLYFQGMEM